MHPEAAFLAGYALVLTAVAAGLGWVGRRTTDPWSSRMLAASRQAGEARAGEARAGVEAGVEEEPGWPHTEVPAFHAVVGIVALAAALLLVVVGIVRHHEPVEFVVQAGVIVFVGRRLVRQAGRHRAEPARKSG